MFEVDIAIVGAGAAGLAAGRRLADTPASTLVLEVRDRIGGRAHTQTIGGYPLDLGCGWLHSADVNDFARLAPSIGFPLDRTPPHWMRQAFDADFSRADQRAFGHALSALEGRIEAAAKAGEDVAVSTLMHHEARWRPLLDAFSSYYNGAEFDRISTLDYARYQDTGVNWRTPAGYGALIVAMGASLPVRLGAPVTLIDRTGTRLRLETPGGAVAAKLAILTVPSALLADGAPAFRPELPQTRQAAAGLPLGLANKVTLRVEAPAALPEESHLFGKTDTAATGSYHLRPFGRPLIEGFLGGSNAQALELEGAGGATAFAIEELVALLGSSVRKTLHPLAETAWRTDPWARGSYSHALPGQAAARAALLACADSRIFIAGEAVSADFFSTAHGAARTGAAAAQRALATL